jgi:hypothetical protein
MDRRTFLTGTGVVLLAALAHSVLWLAGAARIVAFVSRTKDGQSGGRVPNSLNYQEQPVVVPHVMHLRHVPLRTMVNWPQSPQESPS